MPVAAVPMHRFSHRHEAPKDRHRGRARKSQDLSVSPPVLPAPGVPADAQASTPREEATMHGIIYLVGLIVVIMFILSFLGLR
jgi:hypothetical protein